MKLLDPDNQIEQRTKHRFAKHQRSIYKHTDRLFAVLMGVQWVACILAASLITPKTWVGATSSISNNLWAAIILGGGLSLFPIALAVFRPGRPSTRYTIAVTQMLMSSLLIHISGGRVETHFHIFGSLAFLSFYRDWRVLLPATVVVALDHILRGFFWPQSIYSIVTPNDWRWLEHAGWVLFEDTFLLIAIRRSVKEMWNIAKRTTEIRYLNDDLEKRVEARTFELNGSNQRFRDLFENAPVAYHEIDIEGRYVRINRTEEQLLGYSNEELVGRHASDFIVEKSSREAIAAKLAGTLKLQAVEQTFIRKDGSRISVIIEDRLIKNEAGEITGIRSTLQDITELKLLEDKVQRGQKLASIGQLAAGIAHEINTPTQYLGDNVRFLEESFADFQSVLEKTDAMIALCRTQAVFTEFVGEIEATIEKADVEYLVEEVPKAFRQALNGVARITKIVQSMKDFAHPGATGAQAADLNRAVESTITVASNEWKYVADVETHYDLELPLVSCHISEINQVILNLIVNAAHSIADVATDLTNGKGKITVTTGFKDNWAEISIADTGGGITDDNRKKVFDPFFTTKEVGKGTGQGLAIAHSIIVDKHNGMIDVESEPGHGATFIIRLPFTQEADVENTSVEIGELVGV